MKLKSTAATSFILALMPIISAAVPTTVDLPVDLDYSGNKYCVSIYSQCTNGWSFWQHKSGGHVSRGGINHANDTYAWDVNLNSPYSDYDAGKPVFAIESGTISTSSGWAGSSYGQLLINHTTGTDKWSSGYLHMKNITKKSGRINKGDIVGYISNVSPAGVSNHLHFVIYNGYDAGTSSVNVNFSGKTSKAPTPQATPSLYKPTNSSIVSKNNVNFSWYPSSGATNYRIIISSRSDFSGFTDANGSSICTSTCFTATTGSATSLTRSMLYGNQTYYWKVRASGTGTSQWSPTWSFTTNPY